MISIEFSQCFLTKMIYFQLQSIWQEIAYSVVRRYISQDLADAMMDKFKTAHDMTYNTCGDNTNVNTNLFRKAIWNYVQSLYGIR